MKLRRGPPLPTDTIEPIAAGSHPHRMADEWDIGVALTTLSETGDPVSFYPQGGGDAVLARILSVEEEAPRFVIELNEGGALPPGPLTCVAWIQSAKIQFELNGEWHALPDQPTHVPADFPLECLVLERRAATRLETPLGVYYVAAFVLDGRPYELQLYDFSLGGVGMRAAPREAVGLYVGRKLQRVRLELGPGSVMIADLEIRLSRTFRSFLLGEQVQIGCRFLNLSPAMQAELTRLLTELDNGRRRS